MVAFYRVGGTKCSSTCMGFFAGGHCYLPHLHHSLVKSLSRVQLFAAPWTIAHQASLSMGFPRQEDWCGLAKLLKSCPALCNLMDCTPPGSSVHGILPARILEWAAMPSSRGFSQPRDQTCICYISCIGRWVLYH